MACKQLCFPPRKSITRRIESTDLEPLEPFDHSVVLMTLTKLTLPLLLECKKKQFDLSQKTMNYYSLTITFLVENGNYSKQEETGGVEQRKI